ITNSLIYQSNQPFNQSTIQPSTYSTQSAIKILVSLVPPLFLLLENAIFLPSGLNMGNASKPLSRLILVKPDPSSFTVYILKGNPLGYSWLDAKIILLLSGINEGAQFAWPNRVT